MHPAVELGRVSADPLLATDATGRDTRPLVLFYRAGEPPESTGDASEPSKSNHTSERFPWATDLGEEAAGVYGAANDFAAHGYEYGVDMGAPFAAVAQHLENARGNEQWVDAVRQAFVNADSGSVPGAVVSVDDTAIAARLTAGGLDGPAPVVITVDDPLVHGAPRTSGSPTTR